MKDKFSALLFKASVFSVGKWFSYIVMFLGASAVTNGLLLAFATCIGLIVSIFKKIERRIPFSLTEGVLLLIGVGVLVLGWFLADFFDKKLKEVKKEILELGKKGGS